MSVAVTLSPPPILAFFNNAGEPAAGGSVLTQVGFVNYPTYQDSGGNQPLPNPIPLNSRGEISNAQGTSCQLFLQQGVVYSFTIYDAAGNVIDTATNVSVPLAVTLASIGALLYPQTTAESLVSVLPTVLNFPEGDLRRYGASPGSTTPSIQTANATALNAALLVSAAGGSAAYIPPGVWYYNGIVSTGNATYAASSMYGAGESSVLIPASGFDGLTFVADTTVAPAVAVGTQGSRFFRDFMIQGFSNTISTNNGITISPTGRVGGIQFSNLSIENFAIAVNQTGAGGLWNSSFTDCFLYNNYQGYQFAGLSIVTQIRGGFVQCGGMTQAGSPTRYGIFMGIGGGNVPQSMHIQGVQIYGYDVNVWAQYGQYIVLENCDLSNFNVIGVKATTISQGITIRDCWIQALAGSTTCTYAIHIDDLGVPLYSKVIIDGNQILGNTTSAGIIGIYLGGAEQAQNCTNNTIGTAAATAFATGVQLSSAQNAIIKGNSIYATTQDILVANTALNAEIGPNSSGSNGAPVPLAFASSQPSGFKYTQLNVPMSGKAAFVSATTVAVAFTNPLPTNINYKVALGGNAAGYCWPSAEATTGFTINCSASNSNSTDWSIVT
jgi:hypothetical protein